jgi:acetate kinase
MDLLNRRSGLLDVSNKSLDTRVLIKEYRSDPQVELAMEMFAYRALNAIGGFLCALRGAEAVIFGGAIAENTPLVRQRICEGLRWCGLEIDDAANQELIDVEGRLSTEKSQIQTYIIPVKESLQIAHECCRAIAERS